MVKVVASRVLINPFADRGEHLPLDFDSLVAKGWVMESTENIVGNLFNRDRGVFPSI